MHKIRTLSIIDGHCDTLTNLLDQNCSLNENRGHVNLAKLKAGGVTCQFFAAWIGPIKIHGSPLKRGLKLIDRYHIMLKENHNSLVPILSYDDIKKIDENSIGTLLTVEGGDILEGDITNLRILHLLGVRLMTLTWNYRNEICDGILEDNSASGLSNFGIAVVEEMNRLNMIIDVSHISIKGFWDVLEHTNRPIIASHSNAKGICSHPRNLDDEQIRAISRCNGVIGINFYGPFLASNKPNLDDIIRHIEYIAALGGTETIGFGSDFDGMDKLPEGIQGPQNFPRIIDRLLQLNYLESDVKAITSGNYTRVIKTILGQENRSKNQIPAE